MRKWLRRAFDFIGTSFHRLGKLCYRGAQERRIRAWNRANGDKTLRLDYDLTTESLVFDVGGFQGQWSSDIFSRYVCTIHVFEPIPAFAEDIRRRYSGNKFIHIHTEGLAPSNAETRMSVAEDASSTFVHKPSENVPVKLVSVSEFCEKQGIQKIDLMKLNIEGAEYDLLENIISTGLVRRIRDLQIQFHDFVPDAEARMREIHRKLEKTHKRTYEFEFVWENWRIVDDSTFWRASEAE